MSVHDIDAVRLQAEVARLTAENEKLRRTWEVEADAHAANVAELRAELAEARKENTTLRGLLAFSKEPCIHCKLPSDDTGRCISGFPGCARADDMMACEKWNDVTSAPQPETPA